MKKCNYDLIKRLLLEGCSVDVIMNQADCKRATIYKVAKMNAIKVSPRKYLYMKVTKDEYELPLLIADSFAELAKMDGVDIGTVLRCIFCREKYGAKSQYVRVLIDDETED